MDDGVATGFDAAVIGVIMAPHTRFLTVPKRGDILKILAWDGSGLCLFAKRLEQRKFVWPPIVEGRLQLTPAQLALLVEGIDWRRTVAPNAVKRPEAV